MLDEQEARGHVVGGAQGRAPAGEDLRRELEGLRLETRNYVKLVLRNYVFYKLLRAGGKLDPSVVSLRLPDMAGAI